MATQTKQIIQQLVLPSVRYKDLFDKLLRLCCDYHNYIVCEYTRASDEGKRVGDKAAMSKHLTKLRAESLDYRMFNRDIFEMILQSVHQGFWWEVVKAKYLQPGHALPKLPQEKALEDYNTITIRKRNGFTITKDGNIHIKGLGELRTRLKVAMREEVVKVAITREVGDHYRISLTLKSSKYRKRKKNGR